MNIEYRAAAFEMKSVDAAGIFEGYGSVFGTIDTYDDTIVPGAFAESLAAHKAKGTLPAMLWQHRSSEPIGVYLEMDEDNIGLKVKGQLVLGVQRADEAYKLMQAKALTGLSIGYVTREDSYDRVTGIRTLKKVDLWEVSPVTFPANDPARIQGVKSIELIEDLKSAEAYLRDVGMSRSEAKAFISRLRSLGQRDVDEGKEWQELTEALARRGAVFAK